jgi:hypothetical protein
MIPVHAWNPAMEVGGDADAAGRCPRDNQVVRHFRASKQL